MHEPARMRVGDIDIAYRIEGNGPPLVLLHGLACGQRMWLHQRRTLARDFRVITYDQRGHGASGTPAEAKDYSAGHLARDLVGVLDALGLDRVAVVGFSMGGGPALGLALAQPQRVSHLILADVGAGADDAWRMQWLTRRWIGFLDHGGWDELLPDMLRSELFRPYTQRRALTRAHMAGLIARTPLTGLRHTLSEVLAKRRSLFRMRGPLQGIRVPTLITLGQHDGMCRNAARLMAETIPSALLHRIADAGHMAPLEQPEAFNHVVRDFLAK
jgi:3-oxoadipate enol-lactonase